MELCSKIQDKTRTKGSTKQQIKRRAIKALNLEEYCSEKSESAAIQEQKVPLFLPSDWNLPNRVSPKVRNFRMIRSSNLENKHRKRPRGMRTSIRPKNHRQEKITKQ
ncbi:MAG: hypothetical protein CL912_07050 [Deltaproteobacteria bacterium]|nr:hypothetical protein [Deltaproteobacteria bacterium]